MKPLNVVLVGCGHMGTHHARVISQDPRCRLVAAVDIVPERAALLSRRHGAAAATSVPEGIDAAVIATPTITHLDVAAPLVEQGIWCLVEKPLAPRSGLARRIATARNLVVGHIERFNPAVRAAGDVAPQVVEARRLAPPSGRSRDIDVVLDLMVHDLDLILAWGGEVEWLDAVGVAVLSEKIDTASVRLRTKRGLTATLLASRVASAAERTLRLYQDGSYTHLDLLAGTASTERGVQLPGDGSMDALTAQWNAFVDAVREDSPAAVNGRAGLDAVALAERIVQQIVGS